MTWVNKNWTIPIEILCWCFFIWFLNTSWFRKRFWQIGHFACFASKSSNSSLVTSAWVWIKCWYKDLNWEKSRGHFKHFILFLLDWALLKGEDLCRSTCALYMVLVMNGLPHWGCLQVYRGRISTSTGWRPDIWWVLLTWFPWVPKCRNFLRQMEHW